MLVFWKARITCLAVPRTGTTSVEIAFGRHADMAITKPPRSKHVTALKAPELLRPLDPHADRPMDYVACIREPVERLCSWYMYRQRPQIAGTPRSTAGLSFEQFAAAYMADRPPEYANVGMQSRFLGYPNHCHHVRHIFAFEHLEELVRFIAHRAGIEKPPLPKANTAVAFTGNIPDAIRDDLRVFLAKDYQVHQAALSRQLQNV